MAEKDRKKRDPDFKNCKLIAVAIVNIAGNDHEVRIPVNEAFKARWQSRDADVHERAYNYLAVRVKTHLKTQGVVVLGHIEGDAMQVKEFVNRSFETTPPNVGEPRIVKAKKQPKGVSPDQLSFLPKE